MFGDIPPRGWPAPFNSTEYLEVRPKSTLSQNHAKRFPLVQPLKSRQPNMGKTSCSTPGCNFALCREYTWGRNKHDKSRLKILCRQHQDMGASTLHSEYNWKIYKWAYIDKTLAIRIHPIPPKRCQVLCSSDFEINFHFKVDVYGK